MADTEEDGDFRDRARGWLRANAPRGEDRPVEGLAMREFDLAWQRAQYEGGWAGISWPSEYGGLGLSLTKQLIWHEEYVRSGAPLAGTCFTGNYLFGPTLIAAGTHEQRDFHLRQILKGEAIWCQGFSEPNAGSDLASLRTSGHVDGADLVVSGEKIWTSYGHVADYQGLLVRTGEKGSRHRGLTWIICDLRAPNITIRPIKILTGNQYFCSVVYNGARIPLSNIVGTIDDGWRVALITLSFERGSAFVVDQLELGRRIQELIETARNQRSAVTGRPMIEDEGIAGRLGELKAEILALRAINWTNLTSEPQAAPGPISSIIRLYYSQTLQKFYRLAMDVIGSDGLHLSSPIGPHAWSWPYLRSYSSTIAGGTSEIQRNIIGERILGLPRQASTER